MSFEVMRISKTYKILIIILLYCIANSKNVAVSNDSLKVMAITSFVSDSVDFKSIKKLAEPEEKYLSYAMARFEQHGISDEKFTNLVSSLREKKMEVHSMPGVIRLIYNYYDCPVVRGSTQSFVKKAFDRKDNHNMWFGEGSESDVSILRTSGYLFAQKALLYGTFFEGANVRIEEMKRWIMDWSSKVYETGTADFNSSSSTIDNIIGWLNLYDFAEDDEVKLAARAVLDYYSTEMALHYTDNYVGGAEMKGTIQKNHNKSAYYYYNWFWFSSEDKEPVFSGDNFFQLLFAATSSYRPPSLLVNYVHEGYTVPKFYKNSRPSYWMQKPSFNKLLYYKDENFTLGSLYSAYGGWTKNSSEILNWKLLAKYNDKIAEIRGNGSFWNNYSGLGKDPWTQWGQYENILIQLTKVPENAESKYEKVDALCKEWDDRWKKDFKERFGRGVTKKSIYSAKKDHRFVNESYLAFPIETEFSDAEGIWFVNYGSVYIAILGVPSFQPTSLRNHGDKKLLVIQNEPGKVCGFVVDVYNSSAFANYDDFKANYIRKHIMYLDAEMDLITYESIDGKLVEMLFRAEGEFEEPIVDWGYGITKPTIHIHEADFNQPDWDGFDNAGRVPLLVAEKNRLYFDEDWPVFSGPVVNLSNSVLEIHFAGKSYIVDYNGKLPVFKE